MCLNGFFFLPSQALQDEAIRKEKSEEEILSKCPDKRFSTFLVQPNRPKPVVKILLKDDKKDNSKVMSQFLAKGQNRK